MKKIILSSLSLALLGGWAGAQEVPTIEVKEVKDILNGDTRDAFAVDVYGNDKGLVEKDLKSALKDKDAKVSTKKDFFADNAMFKEFGDNNTVDVYAKIEEKTENVFSLVAAVDLGGAYLSSADQANAVKLAAFKKWLREVAVQASRDAVAEEVKTAEKLLSKQEKTLDGLKKDKENLEKDIKDNENKIEESKKAIEADKKAIEENTKKQGETQSEIEKQRVVVKDLQLKEKAVK